MPNSPPPGDSFTPDLPPTLLPHLEHMYRFIADMGAESVEAPNMGGTGQTVSAANMARGAAVTGPKVNGKVLENSGADLATRKVYMLESRYTILTDDESPILVNAKGLFNLDPAASQEGVGNSAGSQDRQETYSHLTYSAPTSSSYSWMNDIVALGVMNIWDGKIVNDAYRVETISLEDARDMLSVHNGKRSD